MNTEWLIQQADQMVELWFEAQSLAEEMLSLPTTRGADVRVWADYHTLATKNRTRWARVLWDLEHPR